MHNESPRQEQPTDLQSEYRDHLSQLDTWLAESLERASSAGSTFGAVVFHSGRPASYHRDDRPVVFRPAAHFRRWVPPLEGPEHLVLARPGAKVKVVRVMPTDFWFETEPPTPSHYESAVDLFDVSSFDQARALLGDLSDAAYVGDSPQAASALGIADSAVEPEALMMPLDWYRATKTPYEVSMLRLACHAAARGHRRAKQLMREGSSELEIHLEYLKAVGASEHQLPYDSIIAHNAKSAILHYERKRGPLDETPSVLLVDAGAAHCGYAADITRTWTTEKAPAMFRSLVAAVDAMERSLVAMVRPGRSYVEIHLECHRQIAEILCAHGLVTCGADEAVERRLTRTFMPHGVGHQLGLQVHDVGGHQSGPDGGTTEPPNDHVLRNTRTLEPGHVVTIEPGLYFIPALLDPLRDSDASSLIDWQQIDALIPYGGVRIEDDIVCTATGFEDLTRSLVDAPER